MILHAVVKRPWEKAGGGWGGRGRRQKVDFPENWHLDVGGARRFRCAHQYSKQESNYAQLQIAIEHGAHSCLEQLH